MSNFEIDRARLKAKQRPPADVSEAAADKAAEVMGWAEPSPAPPAPSKGKAGRPVTRGPRPGGEVRPSFGLDAEVHHCLKMWLAANRTSVQDYFENHVIELLKKDGYL